MLVLVFNPDQHVKDAVVNAYIRLYIKPVSGKKLVLDRSLSMN